jgi:hypothetical protein
MRVEFKVEKGLRDENVLVIDFTPLQSVKDGLKIIYGEVTPMSDLLGRQEAFTHDLYKDVSSYELPPDFDPKTLVEVNVDDKAAVEEGSDVIGRW